MALANSCLWIRVTKNEGQMTRKALESAGIYDKTRKVKSDNSDLEIPIIDTHNLESILNGVVEKYSISSSDLVQVSKSTPADELFKSAKNALQTTNDWSEDLINDIPKHWEKHDDLILFPINAFKHPKWKTCHWTEIAKTLNVKRLAKKSVITNDDFRTPNVEMLLGGDNVWATRKENNILYTWNITKSMFSVGNITEKQRIGKFNCKGQIIVDLFAGIGYFTLTYLIHAQADHVYACEWNPEAVKALKMNLKQNHVQDKCTVLQGDNRTMAPKNVADHVNLGLIPSSSISYQVACQALNQKNGGFLHIHGNFKGTEWNIWANQIELEIKQILGSKWNTKQTHTEMVKSFAPKVYHLVVDLLCTPVF